MADLFLNITSTTAFQFFVDISKSTLPRSRRILILSTNDIWCAFALNPRLYQNNDNDQQMIRFTLDPSKYILTSSNLQDSKRKTDTGSKKKKEREREEGAWKREG